VHIKYIVELKVAIYRVKEIIQKLNLSLAYFQIVYLDLLLHILTAKSTLLWLDTIHCSQTRVNPSLCYDSDTALHAYETFSVLDTVLWPVRSIKVHTYSILHHSAS